ncbi:MAG: hypothetical protein K2N38_02745 [Oscillospiraceae bacterium]|nr:hypothetical protein [Oscillospiraceae bacterium]
MKKALIIIAAIIGGALCNVIICAIAIWLWSFNPGICMLAMTAVILGFCALLNTAAKKVRGFGVKRSVLPACAQMPITAVAVLFFAESYHTYINYKPTNDMWSGMRKLGTELNYGLSKFWLVIVLITTVCAVIAAVISYLKEKSSADNNIKS